MNPSFVASGTFLITPSDTADLSKMASCVRCDTAGGTISYISENDLADTQTLAVGEILTVRIKKVLSTGTTATGLHGYLY